MPNASCRPWFIEVAKIFSGKPNNIDFSQYAEKLGIADPDDLLACLQDTTSNTTRKIIRLLYTPSQLMSMSGTDVPSTKRQLIRGRFNKFDDSFLYLKLL